MHMMVSGEHLKEEGKVEMNQQNNVNLIKKDGRHRDETTGPAAERPQDLTKCFKFRVKGRAAGPHFTPHACA